ncbi:MAG: hypothetical protein HGA49_08355 [Eubacteriaceae bacterium]|nr:hypothetical protein [Eubacteriaceae bacterium]
MNDKMKELKALLKYLVNHNEDHAQEIIDLAKTADALGNKDVFDLMKQGAYELQLSNITLKKALDLLRSEE